MPELGHYDCKLCGRTTTFVRVERACEILEVDRRTIYRYMEEDKIGYRLLPSGKGRRVCHECLLKVPEELC